MGKLFSPANLYIAYPENKHIGTHPNTKEYVNKIPRSFYSGLGIHSTRAMATATVSTMSMSNVDVHVGNSVVIWLSRLFS